MRIVMFIDGLGAGGKERRLVELLKGLATCEDIVCELALMSDEIHYQEIMKLGIRIRRFIRRQRKDPRVFLEFFRYCHETKPDIIHVWDSMTAVYAVPTAKLLGIELVNGMITDAPSTLKPLSRRWIRSKLTFPFSSKVLANSHAGLRAYNPPPDKGVVIHNGFDLGRIVQLEEPALVRKRLSLTTPRIVGMVARFSPHKDYTTFLEAANLIVKHRDDVTFVCVGDGELLQDLSSMVHPCACERIRFAGRQAHIESIVNVFDIGVLLTSSRVTGEGISNSIMEYMALAKPVIATADGGTPELLIDGQTGFLIPAGDVSMLVELINRLLDDRELCRRMGFAGAERIRRHFPLEKMVSKTLELYLTVLGDRPSLDQVRFDPAASRDRK